MILISGCYKNHCENRFSDSRQISSPAKVLLSSFFLKFQTIFPIFPQTPPIFFLTLALRMGGPGYATSTACIFGVEPTDLFYWSLEHCKQCIQYQEHCKQCIRSVGKIKMELDQLKDYRGDKFPPITF